VTSSSILLRTMVSSFGLVLEHSTDSFGLERTIWPKQIRAPLADTPTPEMDHKHAFNSNLDGLRQSMPTAQNLTSKLLHGRPDHDLVRIHIRRLLDRAGDGIGRDRQL
jgi:hypothetical protein